MDFATRSVRDGDPSWTSKVSKGDNLIKIISLIILLEGLLWALFTGWTYLALSGFSEPVSFIGVLLYYGENLIGAGLLIVGAIFVQNQIKARLGSLLICMGCIFLTGILVWEVVKDFQPNSNSAISGPDYGVDAFMIALVVLSNIGAYKIYQKMRSKRF